ncbi:MAG: hypothetical protein DME41_04320 [Verrucomicrobia bacterium]|nr:MAG: hypothetical protein DME41_04320 [Verrucomicrobiota bacterium]
MVKDYLEGKPLRHPLHPMLVHFPIGLFFLSFLFDLASLVFRSQMYLVRDSFYAMLLGAIMALVAAVPGFVDYTDIRSDHPGERTATAHLILNLIIVGLYGINLGVRSSMLSDPRIRTGPFVLSLGINDTCRRRGTQSTLPCPFPVQIASSFQSWPRNSFASARPYAWRSAVKS